MMDKLDDDMCIVYTEDDRLKIKTANGEEVGRVISISAEQDVDLSKLGYCRVYLEVLAKVE